MTPPDRLISVENQFAALATQAKFASDTVKRLATSLRKLEAALDQGDVAAAIKIGAELHALAASLSKAIDAATDVREDNIAAAFGSANFLDEIIRAAQAIGLPGVRSTEGVLFSYPFTVERNKNLTLKLGKNTIRAIRPNAVAKILSEARARSSNLNRPEFLASLEQGFLLASSRTGRELVPVREVYETLTLLPGSKKEYTFFDFLVHLNEIDRAGPHVTQAGRRISFPSSTATKGGKGERLVTQDGREVIYAMIRFQPLNGAQTS